MRGAQSPPASPSAEIPVLSPTHTTLDPPAITSVQSGLEAPQGPLVRLGVRDGLPEEYEPHLLQWGHSPRQRQVMGWATSQRGWGPPSSLHVARVAGPGRPPPPTATPRPHFPSPSGTRQKSSAPGTVRKAQCRELGHAGARRGHEVRAELFLLEVSRAGTITNLQAPLLKCHPPPSPTTTGAVSITITCACYKTTARLTLCFSQKPDKTPSILGSAAAAPSLATASSAWPCQRQGRTFTCPSEEG